MYRAIITVELRPKILDVQGKAVENALHSLGYRAIERVRMGKAITMNVATDSESDAQRIVEEACAKLLANPTVEDYRFQLERTANGAE